jgi:hypothetical protein
VEVLRREVAGICRPGTDLSWHSLILQMSSALKASLDAL